MNHIKPAQTLTRFQPLRGDTAGALHLAIARFDRHLRRAAEKLARGDIDVANDLYQVAITHLWELDPARFDRDDEGYLWKSMVSRMLNARRNNQRDPTRPPLALRFP
jgi:DNA-directed RNA polymerase specialized sigma24 family protein